MGVISNGLNFIECNNALKDNPCKSIIGNLNNHQSEKAELLIKIIAPKVIQIREIHVLHTILI